MIDIDRERKRIGLSIRQLLDDPWPQKVGHIQVGQLIQATIVRLVKFGAFARLENLDVEGLIHISELSDQRIEHPKEVVKEEEVVTLRVINIDTKRRRIGLSLRKVDSPAYSDLDWEMALADDGSEIPADTTTMGAALAEVAGSVAEEAAETAVEPVVEEIEAEEETPEVVEEAAEEEVEAEEITEAEEEAPEAVEEPAAEVVEEAAEEEVEAEEETEAEEEAPEAVEEPAAEVVEEAVEEELKPKKKPKLKKKLRQTAEEPAAEAECGRSR